MDEPPDRLRRKLARDSSVGRAARSAVGALVAQLGAETAEAAKLLVTELATNALRHGRGEITLEIQICDGRAHFSVLDEGRGLIQPVDMPGHAGGYGLRLVDELADDWGVEAGRSRVWFILSVGAS